jgi:hypothetical protein
MGILTAGSGTKLVAGNTAVTQTNSSSSNPKVWNFTWKAPEAGTGQVTFYGAFTVNKPFTKTSTMTVQENTGVGISEYAVLDMKLYPNPVKDVLTIDISLTQPIEGNINVTDITGSQVVSIEEAFLSGQNTIKIPVGDLSQGVYFVKVQTQDDFATRKVLIW